MTEKSEEASEEQAGEDSGETEGTSGSTDDQSQDGDESEVASKEDDDSSQEDTPDTSEDEEPQDTAREVDSGGKVEGVQFKGATKHGEVGDTRKHIPDAKGGAKKRIESDYGMKQGVKEDDDPNPEKTPAIDPVSSSP